MQLKKIWQKMKIILAILLLYIVNFNWIAKYQNELHYVVHWKFFIRKLTFFVAALLQ